MPVATAASPEPPIRPGGREMETRIDALDWSATSIGRREKWSPALKTMVRILLANRFPMLLWWGPEYISIYNDAYMPILGKKHPWALGKPVRECWSEIWEILAPLIDTPFEGGPATWSEDIELYVNRSGFVEETHFTIAYSPVPDETAPRGIGGVLATVHEITAQILGQRRGTALRELASVEARSAEEACVNAAAKLAVHKKDIPFALIYLCRQDGSAELAATAHVENAPIAGPSSLRMNDQSAVWPVYQAQCTGQMQIVDLDPPLTGIEDLWPEPPKRAAVLPIRSPLAHQFAGFLVVGLNPSLSFDEPYADFLNLITSQIATAISTARAYEEERKRAEALAEIDRAKTAFFSNVSHEFRTPLTLMLGPLEQVLQDEHLGKSQREQVDTAHRNGLRLLKLVNSLLDFSRIEAGRMKGSYTPVDLPAVTRDFASNFRSAMEAGGLQFVVDCVPLPEPVYVDVEMWEKIVLNLLSNAFKFTFEGRVAVTLEQADQCAVLSVSDTGTGIPDTALPHIFQRFHRVEGAQGRSYEGTGIGLALVQELVKMHGGAVTVQSQLGKGSVFSVRIPFGQTHLPRERVRTSAAEATTSVRADTYVEEALRWVPASNGSSSGIRPRVVGDALRLESPETASNAGRTPRVLLAEDNADLRDYVARLLGNQMHVTAVSNGQEALVSALKEPPDLVLTDVMMPLLDGFGLLRELRANPQTSATPVILLSARAGEESRVEGVSAGADDYLVKPFSSAELLARVTTHLKLARARQETVAMLAASEERFRQLAEIGPQMVWLTGPRGELEFVNRRWVEYSGLDLEATRDPAQIESRLHPEDNLLAHWQQSVAAGTPFELEARLRRKDGEFRWFMMRSLPVRDEHGQVQRWFGTSTDIHESKLLQLELQRANQDLEQFAYSASHDLQEPLRSVKIFSELVFQSSADRLDGEAREFLTYVREGARRMDILVRDLLAYTLAGKGDKATEPVDANAVFQTVLANLAGALSESGATVTCEPLPSIRVHETQLQQLFQNLISNALKYHRPGVPPVVHVSARRDKEGWIFSVGDNGIGIAPDFKEKVFGLFKRLHTRDEYAGTGIGLAICKRIVERHNGRIWVESEPGNGSIFFFTLPSC